MPRLIRAWAGLSPAGDAQIHQTRVGGTTVVRPQTEALGDAGPESFDQDVGAVDEASDSRNVSGVLQIRLDYLTASIFRARRCRRLAGTLDPYNVGAEVGQHRRGMRTGSHPTEFDHTVARQGGCRYHTHTVASF
ncbi:hypothetical protein MPHLEI_07449 [Mycolicibacterium phlei RIVM601174]|nr:hypothetical protein MPHLEI_07449 [Mycolicibacterium phlei RIVM601174]MBF4191621.1 hypothetical protein [Mycolicibacterium phlei]